jgi:hypothetical protein
MAKDKDNEQQPEVIDSEQKSPVLTLDEVEYDVSNFTDYQKDIYNDILNYLAQQQRLERWKQGQVHMLRVSLNGEVEESVDKEVEAEA